MNNIEYFCTYLSTGRPAEKGGGAEGVTVWGHREARGLEFKIHQLKLRPADPMMFFLISGRNSNMCGRYDLILLITWFWAKIRTSADALTFFCSSRDFGAPLTKEPKRNFCPGARNFSRRL